jgi:hypothetical protein
VVRWDYSISIVRQRIEVFLEKDISSRRWQMAPQGALGQHHVSNGRCVFCTFLYP